MDDSKQPNIRFYRYVTLWDFKRTSFNPKSNDPFGEMLRQDLLNQSSKTPKDGMLFDVPFVTLNNAKHPYSSRVFMVMPRPRPTLFEVRKPTNGKWRIVGFVNGLRKQFWFKSEKDAKQAAKDRNAEVIAHESFTKAGFQLSKGLIQ
jgi:hypothetical protein